MALDEKYVNFVCMYKFKLMLKFILGLFFYRVVALAVVVVVVVVGGGGGGGSGDGDSDGGVVGSYHVHGKGEIPLYATIFLYSYILNHIWLFALYVFTLGILCFYVVLSSCSNNILK